VRRLVFGAEAGGASPDGVRACPLRFEEAEVAQPGDGLAA
jgi:hypothetical protein